MKKLALIFGIAVCFVFVGCDDTDEEDKRITKNHCGDIEFGKCVDYYMERCDNSDFVSCGIVGDLYHIKKDFDSSMLTYKWACENVTESMIVTHRHIKGEDEKVKWEAKDKNSPSLKKLKTTNCGNVGFQYKRGEGVDKDSQKAIYYYQIACDLGNGSSCSDLGFYYDKGKDGIEKNHHKASQYYKKSCDLNSYLGCHNLGDMYYRGDGFSKNYEYAMYYFNKACDLGYNASCKRAQILLPQMPRNNISRPYM